MANAQALQKQLDEYRIELDYESDESVYSKRIKRLPTSLRGAAFAVLGLDAAGKELPHSWDEPAKWDTANRKLQASLSQLDKCPATKRKQVFACFAPKMADALEAAWQHLKGAPYRISYASRPFRAPKDAAVTLEGRVSWLNDFAESVSDFDPSAITVEWLAQWAPHAFGYQADCVVPILIAALNGPAKKSDPIYEILRQSVTREHEIGIMGKHAIGALLGSDRQAGWELIEKTLLAAQRQEGLRQSILESAELAHPEAFRRLLQLILEKKLIRFSSVCLAINGWFGLLWDSASTQVMTENVESIAELIGSVTARKQALKSDDAETVFRGLWAMSYHDAPSTVPMAAKLLKHKSDEIRFVGTWMLTLLGLTTSGHAKQVAIEDDNMQVAILAAIKVEGLNVGENCSHLFDENDSDVKDRSLFVRLEKLFQRLPEKPTTLPAIVWPWTERKVSRKHLGSCLIEELGDRPPTTLLPYFDAFDTWDFQRLVNLLGEQKKWDKQTRESLFQLAGHGSADVRAAAFKTLKGREVSDPERRVLESYLSRTSADLRLEVVDLLLQGSSDDFLASADRLLDDGTRNRRLAGLEMLRQVADSANEESDADGAAKKRTRAHKKKPAAKSKAKSKEIRGAELRELCKTRAANYQAGRKKLTKDEQVQLDAIAASDRESYSLSNAFGLMDPDGRREVVPPQKIKRPGVTKAALACLKDLDDLVHKHRKEIVQTKNWRGLQEQPLGQVDGYDLPTLNPKKPIAPQRKKFPLIEIWEDWRANLAAKLKDKDGLELLRASFAADQLYGYTAEEIGDWARKPAQKKIAAQVFGETNVPKLRYEEVVSNVVDWLFYSEIPKGCSDYLLDCTENSFAIVPQEYHDKLVKDDGEDEDYDDDSNWREIEVFCAWQSQLNQFIGRTGIKLTKAQEKRIWQLRRFHDEPVPGATRERLPLDYVAKSVRKGDATFDDLADVLLGPNRAGWGAGFDELSDITRVALSKDEKELLEKTKGLKEWLGRARDRIIEIELERGEAKTVATDAALALSSFHGTDTLFRIMSTLGKEKFKILRGWSAEPSKSRSATLTKLIASTFPGEGETTAQFTKLAKQAIKEGYCSETRLLELAFLAPQWTKFVEAHLKWNGFAEGLYWFIAHMSNWDTTAQDAAAGAEGLQDDADEMDDDDFDEDDEGTEEAFEKPPQLSAWQRLVIERTPLTVEERYEGAVDVEWFHRTWDQLGGKQWQAMADAAKFSANAAQAKKAQFLADVLLGKTKKNVLVEGIKKRNLKDHVRLLGLLPLEKGGKRSKDLADRYEVLQAYKKYARGLSGLTKPAAFRALEIGMANLARLAGYRDPLRLEWAMEADSVKDLSKGSVAVVKDGVTVTLSLDEFATPRIEVYRGEKKLKSIPAATKKKHAAIRDLADRAKELKSKSSRIKQSLEAAMCRGDVITGGELLQLMQHAILSPQLQRLVLVGEGIMGYPDKGGRALRDHGGKLEPVKKTESLRIAHPSDLLKSKQWSHWQRDCFQAERVQPFKQVFRELYIVTKQEKKDGSQSSRFAGQQISPRQAMALWGSRGWSTQDEVFKTFHEQSLIAEVDFQWDYGTAAGIEGLTLETVQFRKRDEFKPIRLSAVEPRIFSEVMRDVDLVVSVAHRGEVDPEASASTVEMRATLLVETAKLLGLKNVKVKGNHAFIDGHFAEYSLHLGSGNIHRLPGGAIAVIPVHAQHRGRLFLPFADDDPRTAEVVSKMLLLARDDEIQDPMILNQLAIDTGSRKPLVSTPKKKRGNSKAGPKPSADQAGKDVKKQRYVMCDDKSNKFWEIELSGCSVITNWGRIDTKGQSKTKTFEDESKAQVEFDQMIKAKTSKGYEAA